MTTKVPLDLIDSLVAEWQRERPQTAPEPMQTVGRIIQLGRKYEDEVTRLLRPHRLSYSDFDVIATLRRSGQPYALSPTQLQHNVLLTSGAMTACLGRLERAGLISREAGQSDRRRLAARLTAKGHELVEHLIDQRFALARAALEGLDATQVAMIEPILRQLGATASPPPLPSTG